MLSKLPQEVLMTIFVFIDYYSLKQLSYTSKQLSGIIRLFYRLRVSGILNAHATRPCDIGRMLENDPDIPPQVMCEVIRRMKLPPLMCIIKTLFIGISQDRTDVLLAIGKRVKEFPRYRHTLDISLSFANRFKKKASASLLSELGAREFKFNLSSWQGHLSSTDRSLGL
jgi:hypothetical protein